QPTMIPCSEGRFFPFRHNSGSKGTWTYVFLISPLVAQRAVPCCPWPTVLALILSEYIPDSPAITARVPNMAPPASSKVTIESIDFPSRVVFNNASSRKEKRRRESLPVENARAFLFLSWFSLIYQIPYWIFSFLPII